jgi:hypothetical protein
MSDLEIASLRLKIEVLETQVRNLVESVSAFRALDEVVYEKRMRLQSNSRETGLTRYHDKDMVAILVPILHIFNTIQERLNALELRRHSN